MNVSPPKISLLFLILLPVTIFGINTKSSIADFSSSNLPIVIINTNGQNLNPDNRVSAEMGIIWNGNNKSNFLSDPRNNYNGRIEIELHGKSSLGFPKKAFRIETQDSTGENLNVSLLGMPRENDWIFHAPYSDKTLMRNALTYTLAGEINEYAPRVRFFELIINDSYEGIYVLTEKIKRDSSRINIAEITPDDISEPEISGGYIFRKDKTDDGDNIIRLSSGLDLIINEPKKDNIVPRQETWLRNYLNTFEDVLYSGGNYQDYIDLLSFVDTFLMVELTKNIDGYRLSTYFYKDRDGKIVAGPVWDYNLSLGNADYNDGWTAEGWYYPYADRYWFGQLINDQTFWDLCIKRWKELRKYQFNLAHILSYVDEWTELLDQAVERNFERWPIMNIYIWPNPGYPDSGSEEWLPEGLFDPPKTGAPTTYDEEIEYMKNFIEDRLDWMDEQFGVDYVELAIDIYEKNMGHIIFNNQIISNAVLLGSFPQNEPITLIAEPLPGYKFVRWEEVALGKETTTFIPRGAIWKYLDDGSDQGTAWYSKSFNDSNWKEGTSEFGYGDGDESTIVNFGPDTNNKYATTYFRTTFNVTNPDAFNTLNLYLLRDDGAVVYINGKEVFRSNMQDAIINFDTFASGSVSDDGENTFNSYSVDPSFLEDGNNVIGVEIHQANLTSSDISFDLYFVGTKNYTNDVTIISTDVILNYHPLSDSKLAVLFEKSNAPLSPVAISEIHYHPVNGENYEYIELCNIADTSVNFSGFSFVNGIEFKFPQGVFINPGEYIVLSKISENYSHLECQCFQWTEGNLADDGELIILLYDNGLIADSVNYSSKFPWPEEANGTGLSLELKRPFLDNSLPENWQGSYSEGGSPGKTNIRVINELYINEFLASNQTTNKDEYFENNDWIELYNSGTAPIDISGLFLSDDTNRPGMWQIPTISSYITTIQPDSFLIFWADGDTVQGPLHLNFQLNREGESISLAQIVDSNTIFIDSLTYNKQISDISYGRFTDGSSIWHSFSNPTPGFSNIYTTAVEHTILKPGSYNLEQNFPNPFNPSTMINYQISKTCNVELSIYNLLGQKVATLVSMKQQAGRYKIEWNALEFSSGVYFYRLSTSTGFVQTKKLILIR
jgi:hypothetical protein